MISKLILMRISILSFPTITHTFLTAHITTVYCQSLDNSTPTGVQGIIANSPFNCNGFLRRWEMCFASNPSSVNYNITVQLWKPLETNGCFRLEWSNAFQNLLGTDANSEFLIQRWRPRCVNISMPERQNILVLSNYTIGFQISIIGTRFSRQNGLFSTSQTNDIVHYTRLGNISEYDKFCSSSRQLMHSPFIRAVVGECKTTVLCLCIHLIIMHVWRH